MTFRTILLGVAGCFSVTTSLAQLPVSTAAQNKKALLEEMTGIYCYWCPSGHKTAHNIQVSHPPGDVVVVNYHNTGFSAPVGVFNHPDFRTTDGSEIIAGLPGSGSTSGIPAGAINRRIWPGQSLLFISRNYWAGFVNTILAQPSYVNVALEGSLDVATRVLTVNVQAYYTGNSPATANRLNVLLLEDSVREYQVGGIDNYPQQTNADGSYWHVDLLRKALTLPAGETITPTTTGTLINRTYTYTIPQQFKNTMPAMGRLKLAAFITETDTTAITAAYGPITLTGFTHSRDAALTTVSSLEDETCAGRVVPEISFYNNGSEPITNVVFSYNVNGGTPLTYNYSGYLAPATFVKKVKLPQISFTPTTLNTLSVSVSGINGATDQNSSNNTGSRDSINLTAAMAYDTVMRIEYSQLDVNNNSFWKLYEEATHTLVAEDGPFPDVPYMSTEVRSKTFSVKRNTCYKLVLENSRHARDQNYGIGTYKVFSGSTQVIGSFGSTEGIAYSWFKTGNGPLGIEEATAAIGDLSVAPNPAYEYARLNFSLQAAGKVSVAVYNVIGEQVLQLPGRQLAAGKHSLAVPVHDLAAGIYHIRIQSPQGTAFARCSVIH